VLIGDDSQEGLCQMCAYKSAIFKTIKRSSANALKLVHALLFKREYPLRNSVQDEFRGMEPASFASMDLASHFKELSRQKGEPNYALDILLFIKVSLPSRLRLKAQKEEPASAAGDRWCRRRPGQENRGRY